MRVNIFQELVSSDQPFSMAEEEEIEWIISKAYGY